MSGVLERLSWFVTRRRAASLAAVLALVAIALGGLPQLTADASPTGLEASFEDQEEVAARFEGLFGNPDHVVVLLIEAEDVLEPDVLSYVHELARSLGRLDEVRRVDAITTVPIASRSADPEALTLDDLETGDEPEPSAEVLEAMSALVRAEPARYPDGLATLSELIADVHDAPAVEGDTIEHDEAEALRELLRDAPFVTGRLVSRDGTVTAVAVHLRPALGDHDDLDAVVDVIDRELDEHPAPQGVTLIVGGLPHLRVAIVDEMMTDQTILVPLTLLVCLVLLYLSFRWWPGTVFPILTVLLCAGLLVGTMGWIGEPMNIINNIIPVLLIIIGVSDSIHLVGRYREEVRGGSSRLEAADRTVRSMAVACLLTSITTAIGLGSLVVAHTHMLQRFGVTAAAGVLIAYFVTIFFLPPGLVAFRPPAPAKGGPTSDRLETAVVGLTRAVLRRPWTVLACTAVLGGVAGWAAYGIEVDTSLMDTFDRDDPVFVSTRLMEEKLDGVRPLEALVEVDEGSTLTPQMLATVDDAARWLDGQPGVLRTQSPSDVLHETWVLLTGDESVREAPFRSNEQVEALATLLDQREPNPMDHYVSDDRSALRLEARLADVGAQRSLAIIAGLRERLAPLEEQGASVSFTGNAYQGSYGIDLVVEDLLNSLTVAVVIIFAVLTLLFRSLRLGLLSIPPNLIPLVFTVAWMVLRGIPLNIATAIIFSISIGLAVDGTIHVLARFREESRGEGGVDEALVRSARGTGRAIIVSCLTLMLGFGVLLLSSFVPVRHFGEVIAVTIFGCLVATLVVQPALLKVGGAAPR